MSDKKDQNLHNNYHSSLGRRDFIKTSALAGMAGAAFSMGMPLTGLAQDAKPKSGGVLRLGLTGAGTGDSADPGTWANVFIYTGFTGAFNTLVEMDVDGNAVPELAESWESSADAKTWTFKIRQGVTFHNGKAMDADDVVASLNHHRGEDSKSAAKSVLANVADIKAKGKDSITIELIGGNVGFPYILTDYHLVIMPAKEGIADWQSMVGTGGYEITSFEPGVRLAMTRYKDYWKPGRAHFDGAEVIAIADSAARINALVTGEVDIIDNVDLKAADLLKRNQKVTVEENKGSWQFLFSMRCNAEPFKDNNVRLALKYGIDREAILKKVLRGYGTIGNDHPIPATDPFYNSDLPQRPYDPDKSRFYLGKAGLDTLNVKLQVADTAFAGAVDAAILFQNSAKKGGIDLNVSREPDDGYWTNVWNKQPFTASNLFNRPTPDQVYSLAYAKGAAWNDTVWENKRFNSLLLNARVEQDKVLRQEMYHEMQQLVHDDGGSIIPVFASSITARSNKVVHDSKTTSFAILDGLRVIERWWMA